MSSLTHFPQYGKNSAFPCCAPLQIGFPPEPLQLSEREEVHVITMPQGYSARNKRGVSHADVMWFIVWRFGPSMNNQLRVPPVVAPLAILSTFILLSCLGSTVCQYHCIKYMRRSVTERHKRQKLKAEKNAIKVWRHSECDIFATDKDRELGWSQIKDQNVYF